MDVFVVTEDSGEYSDRNVTVVAVYASEDAAKTAHPGEWHRSRFHEEWVKQYGPNEYVAEAPVDRLTSLFLYRFTVKS